MTNVLVSDFVEHTDSKKATNFITVNLYRHIKTAEQYSDWYTGHWWVGCYIWYSEGSGRAAAPPSPLLAVPNV